jgi:SAM-dependent methyltransferase
MDRRPGILGGLMVTDRTTDADVEWQVLTTETGRALVAEVARVSRPGPADLTRWRKGASPEWVAAAMRLAEGRRRGAAKFHRAEAMWFEPTGLEQATAEPVARQKARRFADASVLDLCAGIGGDTLALAAGARRVIAVDRDPGMCRRTLWNAAVYEVADRVAPVCARAEAFPIAPEMLVHIDPDRRTRAARRARNLHDYAPGLEFLCALPRSARGGAVKLGPASDFAAHFGGPGFEVELVSLGGECKEATLWFGDLVTCRRRATTLPAGLSWTDRDGPAGVRAAPAPLGPWVFDPDPALVRSGLLDAFAVFHGLNRVAEGVGLLTGADRVASAFLAAFEVQQVLPLDLKRLRRVVAEQGLGPLEIKPRGLDLRPEAIRDRLHSQGTRPATLLLVGGPGPARAILARRLDQEQTASLENVKVADPSMG